MYICVQDIPLAYINARYEILSNKQHTLTKQYLIHIEI